MKKTTRIIVELVGPALVGTILLFVLNQEEFRSTSGITLRVFLSYLAYAYAFSIVPSLLYALFMEMWLKRSTRIRFGALGVVLLSTALGAAAGGAITLATEAPVAWIGVLVGLILGVVFSFGAPRNEQNA